MTATDYDVIVVGARCAGSPTAMLLARAGHRVLVLDRATFPSDTLSTHLVHPPGVAALHRWGLLEALVATGCPATLRYGFDFGPFTIAGRPRPGADGHDVAYAPRRTVLDTLLVEAAAAAGADVEQGAVVTGLLHEEGRVAGVRARDRAGKAFQVRSRVVVGADGRHSLVAREVRPPAYHQHERLVAMYYSYFTGLPTDGFQTWVRPDRGWATWPTHDGRTLLVVGWPYAEFHANRTDVEGNYLKTLELVPEFAAQVAEAHREEPFHGGAVWNYVRRPFGPGWALVGDAGYNKDPITAMGISDAFRDAELCASAVSSWLRGEQGYDDAMGRYQAVRDADALPMYELTLDLARLAPPDPAMQRLLGAVAMSPEASEGFVSVMAATLSPTAFFAPENVAAILEAEGGAALASAP